MKSKDWKDSILLKSVRVLKKHSGPLLYKELAWRIIGFLSKCGPSDPFSYAIRPVMMHKRLRLAVGAYLALIVGVTSVLGVSHLDAQLEVDPNAPITLPEPQITLATEQRIRFPLPVKEVSQGYWLLHQAVDLRTPQGTEVYPIMSGRVIEVGFEKYGYGNKVVIDHENGYVSLYAHLGEIEVVPGESVSTDEMVGKSGNTGRSTGPHLHLELRENGRNINPMGIFNK